VIRPAYLSLDQVTSVRRNQRRGTEVQCSARVERGYRYTVSRRIPQYPSNRSGTKVEATSEETFNVKPKTKKQNHIRYMLYPVPLRRTRLHQTNERTRLVVARYRLYLYRRRVAQPIGPHLAPLAVDGCLWMCERTVLWAACAEYTEHERGITRTLPTGRDLTLL
jgi:hypothetical protein